MTPFEFGQHVKLAMGDFDAEWARMEREDAALEAKARQVQTAGQQAGLPANQPMQGTLSRGKVTSVTGGQRAPMPAQPKPAMPPKPALPAAPKPAMPSVTKRVSRSAF